MQNLEESSEELATHEIDLGMHRRGEVNESLLRAFGGIVKMLMKHMFGGSPIPVKVKGSRQEIEAFTKVLAGERRYLQTWSKYGLDNPQTYKNKYKLNQLVGKFERVTGLKWPFK
tara:strand:- start:1484 stop:1828 length:345 start_codon:yes stop_codon:yes gene_type:complete